MQPLYKWIKMMRISMTLDLCCVLNNNTNFMLILMSKMSMISRTFLVKDSCKNFEHTNRFHKEETINICLNAYCYNVRIMLAKVKSNILMEFFFRSRICYLLV